MFCRGFIETWFFYILRDSDSTDIKTYFTCTLMLYFYVITYIQYGLIFD